jgi:hypothetical protein
MFLPAEIKKIIFSFFGYKKVVKCDLCNIASNQVGIYIFKYSDNYAVCKRCWIGY